MQLRDALAGDPDTGALVSAATVTAVAADGTVSVDLGAGGVVNTALVLDSYTPASGDVVRVLRCGGGVWLVLGKARTSNPTTVKVRGSLAFPYNVTPAASTAANPLVLPATTIRSYRSNEGWSGAPESNRAGQGAYSTRWGFYRGCYFYGSGAFSALAGRTCTSLSIRLSRAGSGGIAGAENQWLALHAHPTVPNAAPLFTTGAVNVGQLAWNTNGTFTLPAAWGQALIDGTAAGVGHLYSGTADYSLCKSLAEDSLSGRLTIGWS